MIVYLFGVVLFFVCLNFVFWKMVEDNVCYFFFDVVSMVKWNLFVDDCFKLLLLVNEVIMYVCE